MEILRTLNASLFLSTISQLSSKIGIAVQHSPKTTLSAASLTQRLSMFWMPFLYISEHLDKLPVIIKMRMTHGHKTTRHKSIVKRGWWAWRKCDRTHLFKLFGDKYFNCIAVFSSKIQTYGKETKRRHFLDPTADKYNFSDCSSLSELFQWGALH